MPAAKDLTGQRFGRLTAIQLAEPYVSPTGHKMRRWLCRCDCGTERIVVTKRLMTGVSKSCGCLRAEQANKRLNTDNVTNRFDGTMISAIKSERKLNKNNTSGVRGIYWKKSENRWIAEIGFQGKSIVLGRFTRKEDAIKARLRAEEKYYEPVIKEWENLNKDET